MAQMTPYQQDIDKVARQLAFPPEGNILVTGATGLIGSCLVDILMQHSACHIYALGRNRERAMRRFKAYEGDSHFHFLQHDVSLPLPFKEDFHYIIHAASNASPAFFQQSPVEVMKANLNGVCQLVEYGLQHKMRRMVFISSGEVYGEGDGSIFTEKSSGYIDILSPRACYPSSKRASETLCAAYAQEYGADIVIARLCHTYGPFFTESDNRVYAQFIRNVLQGENIVMKSKGEQYRSWIYVVDCVAAILTLLMKGQGGEAYNVADEQSDITIRQLAEKVASISGRQVIMDITADGNTSPITRAVFSTEKIRQTGWKPLFSMDEGLEHTLQTLRQNR